MEHEARGLREQGRSIREIAAELKTSKSTVQRWLARPVTKSFLNPRWEAVRGGESTGPVDQYGFVPPPDVATLLSCNEDTVYACVDWCAKSVAKTDLRVLVTTLPGQARPKCATMPAAVKTPRLSRLKSFDKAKVREVVDHPLVALLAHPCPEMSKHAWLYYLDTQLSLAGNCYVHVVREDYETDRYGQPTRNEGLPVGLWPLLTQHVSMETAGGHVAGYGYGLGDVTVEYPKRDVIHFKMTSHLNPYGEGYGPVRAVYERILLGKNELAYVSALYRNQARPDSLVTLKDGTDDQCQMLQKQLAQRFRQGGMGGPWVVGQDTTGGGAEIDVKMLGWSPKDVLGVEAYKWTKLQIINAFALSAALFDTESSNRATAITARILAQEQAIEPRLHLIEEQLNHDLVPEFDERLAVEFESPVERDEDFELKKITEYLKAGVYTEDEARRMLGLPPKPRPDPAEAPVVPQPAQQGEGGDAARTN